MYYNIHTIKRKEVILMDETMKNATTEELEGQISLFENADAKDQEIEEQDDKSESKDPLKDAIETQLKKIQRQNLLIGAQTACRVILEKIIKAENKPGKRTMNDYRRLIKDIKGFCKIGISRKINADGETEAIEEESDTNLNSTKLMEEAE